jgi:hypothetical protein
MKTIISTLSALFIASLGSVAAAQSPTAPVQITGWGMHYGGKVHYRYQVQNLSSSPITRVLIGHYPHTTDGKAELSIPPQSDNDSLWIPADVAQRPNGWGVKILYAEESDNFSLEWVEAGFNKQMWPAAPQTADAPVVIPTNTAIPAGATWDKFSVTLPEVDAGYVTGHASVAYGGTRVNVPIQKGDSVVPDLMLAAERINQNESNGHWAIFDVSASTKDNYDPAPTLVFEPVIANQTLQPGEVSIHGKRGNWKVKLRNIPERTYQLRFTSNDASGNRAVKTFDYVVAGTVKK